ncbi:GMC family oxidoreductase [Gluconobacter kanchanaburiensis]|uniref:GMC family oxidoreductase n=1 Tax=Gluconobacter kanchanaburiensis NBRC 103587 TaxID=1307948 RepID=A0A511B9D8_9PROT|nr:GMC family oxidoreductase [Gluconobacter kanchanaburiensis]MBF0862776.1 GMC family oxidoreductase [Gluconobacter kanchanaburiensis]GBR68494.1 gluconate 2-dehydrogenase [Gluconobacter kanchanaburiensis NBRC 103587]GEK97055.1 GMC family oxidoreductase [Gluconobacter kanchanaburiensis NBRC 103587]
MDYTRPKADAVIVGLGWAGSLMAEELTRAGLNVVAIERGPWETTSVNFPPAIAADELRYGVRREILKPPSVETLTFRNDSSQTALPGRDWNSWQMGYSVGGAGKHWAANAWRFSVADFQMATRVRERYSNMKLADGLIVQDWGITYDELEPHYDRFEKIAGISGKAGVINGQVQAGGNPFEGSRRNEFPTPPLVRSHWNDIFHDTTEKMGYHPFPIPAGTIGGAFRNPLGIELAPCTYCGFCGFYGCGNFSKSSPNICVIPALTQRSNFTLLTECTVLRINKSKDEKTVTGVTFLDSDGNIGYQPADIVCVSAYQLDNVRLLFLSQIGRPYDPTTGEGTLGRAYNYQTMSYGFLYFENEYMNPFISTGALSTQIDDFNGDNFDHTGLGFLGGAGIQALSDQGTPLGMTDRLPAGTTQWGSAWKKAFAHSYQNYAKIQGQGTSYSHRGSYLSLDPTYKDANGQALLRMTFDYNENDRKMSSFVRGKIDDICKQTGAKSWETVSFPDKHNSPFRPYDSSHTIGGAVMGLDPATSVLNRYQQHWDAHNLFVLGASSYPNNGGYNPTGTLSALTLWTAKAIIDNYVKSPGSLMR